jgi:hypothetical protein
MNLNKEGDLLSSCRYLKKYAIENQAMTLLRRRVRGFDNSKKKQEKLSCSIFPAGVIFLICFRQTEI